MTVPDLSGYRFTKTHEWVRREGERARVGITDHAQAQLGDVIFLELPAEGTVLKHGDRFGTVESVKAASELYTPVGGRVVSVNSALADAPERVNTEPYGEGWMIELEELDGETNDLMDVAAYSASTGGS